MYADEQMVLFVSPLAVGALLFFVPLVYLCIRAIQAINEGPSGADPKESRGLIERLFEAWGPGPQR